MSRIALITGGTRGIGRASALGLAKAGHDVAITYRSSKEAAEGVVADVTALGQRAIAIQADQADPTSAESAVATTVEDLGGLDVVVANAGIAEGVQLAEADSDAYDRTMDTNVRGVFATARAAAAHLGDGGRIIVIGSINADVSLVPGMTLYSTSKAAVKGMVHGLAHDLAGQGTTVNVIQPGPIDTALNPADGPMSGLLTPLTALKRYGTDNEVAALVTFLAGPDSGYITGASIDIDGGLTV